MAIIFLGQSQCVLCGLVVDSNRRFLGLPPLISNELDPLFVFSDSAVHEDCLDNNPLKNNLLWCLEKYHKTASIKGAICEVDGKAISDPRHVIFFGLLTSIKEEPLFKFNFRVVSKLNLKEWSWRDSFLRVAKEFLDSGKWQGFYGSNCLELLINKVQTDL